MELSLASRPRLEDRASEDRCVLEPRVDLKVFDVPLPAELSAFGERVLASGLGSADHPPLVVLGGISGNCFPVLQPNETPGWWSGLVGEGKPLDSRRHYVLGLDFAADDSGTSAPSTMDQARVLAAALDAAGVIRPVSIVGASYGGMVALAFAALFPERVDRLAIISAGAEPHPSSTAARELQRRVVSLGMLAGRGDEALAIARGMAMLTYRTPDEFEDRFSGGIADSAPLCTSEPGAYLHARGQAFRSVMSPGRFLSLSASIDRHKIDPEVIQAPAVVIGAESDQLVFPGQLRRLAQRLAGFVDLHLFDSLYGHDMFLKEAERFGGVVASFLASRR